MEDRNPTTIEQDAAAATRRRSSIVYPASSNAKRQWRSLDELAQTREFREMVHREFPAAASEWDDASSRRTFLKIMGASLALAGVSGCVKPTTEKIVPYVRQPEELIPGKAMFFASAATFRGYARGILVESHEGRPTKIEGNPLHPASLGAADAITQAHVLNLYDPDRSQVLSYAGEVSNWNTFTREISADLAARKDTGGAGIRLLTGTVTSPTLASQIGAFLKAYPKAVWHQYEAVNSDNERLGLKQAFGKAVSPVYHFDKASVIVSLDSNFLMDYPGSVRYSRDFINGRRVQPKQHKKAMNRLYVAESTPTVTGAMADERMRVKPSEVVNIARALRAGTGSSDFLKKLLKDLNEHKGASVIVAGDTQPPEVHALAAALNQKLGNVGKTVDYIEPVEYGAPAAGNVESLRKLKDDMLAGQVDLLIIFGGNPVHDAPVDFGFADALYTLSKSPNKRTVRLGLYYNETSFRCQWHLPMSHELESWSDARAYDGTESIIQPLIAPLYQGRSAHEVLATLLGEPNANGYDIVRKYWSGARSADFENNWLTWLNNGVIPDSASKPVAVPTAPAIPQSAPPAPAGKEIVFRPDPYIWDGRYANNGWLMELPRPLTKLTWDNAALMSPKTFKELGVAEPIDYSSKPQSPIITITVADRKVDAPIWVVPDHPDDCVTVHLGFGRRRSGRIGGDLEEARGFDAYTVRTSGNMSSAGIASMTPTGETMLIACTQNHAAMDQHDRNLIHVVPIAGDGKGEEGPRKISLSMYPPRAYHDDVRQGNKWGMVIDQNACIGCNACMVACQSENNIPVVGKDQVSRGREMHWLRIDTYYVGEPDKGEVEGPFFQPLPCQHCENAPCEVVCPANATMHDAEGTNNMVYNRCIGTRYCSNNCPYKVRHFNFFQYSNTDVDVLKMAANPNVTVRTRGVMEKCSYCVQRINAARITAKKEYVNGQRPDDAIYDGEVVTACQQSCPTQAIYFGNINDKDLSNNGSGSIVRRMLEEEGNYTLLDEELQTQPRTSYLPRYTNRAEKM